MKLFEVTTGYIDGCYVKLLVVCDTPERAKDIARPQFKEYYKNTPYNSIQILNDLKAIELCGDTSIEWDNSEIDR